MDPLHLRTTSLIDISAIHFTRQKYNTGSYQPIGLINISRLQL